MKQMRVAFLPIAFAINTKLDQLPRKERREWFRVFRWTLFQSIGNVIHETQGPSAHQTRTAMRRLQSLIASLDLIITNADRVYDPAFIEQTKLYRKETETKIDHLRMWSSIYRSSKNKFDVVQTFSIRGVYRQLGKLKFDCKVNIPPEIAASMVVTPNKSGNYNMTLERAVSLLAICLGRQISEKKVKDWVKFQ
jgi:hypothetical protein